MMQPGKPARLKTYTAETGLVYQYYFVGKRAALDGAGTEFIFDVSSDRRTRFSVSIVVQDRALYAWREARGRALSDAEIYAGAKMRLLRAFDQTEDLFGEGRLQVVDADALAALLDELGIQ